MPFPSPLSERRTEPRLICRPPFLNAFSLLIDLRFNYFPPLFSS